MCLEKVTRVYDPPDGTERDAFKVFHADSDKTVVGFLLVPGFLHRGVWSKARQQTICNEMYRISSGAPDTKPWPPAYMSGFHVAPDAESAKRWADYWFPKVEHVIVQVKVRNVRLEGTQRGMGTERGVDDLDVPVWVADEILVAE